MYICRRILFFSFVSLYLPVINFSVFGCVNISLILILVVENALKKNEIADNLKLCLDVYITYNILTNKISPTKETELRNSLQVKLLFENENTVRRRIRVYGNPRKAFVDVNAFGCRVMVSNDMTTDPGSTIFIIAGSKKGSLFIAGIPEKLPQNNENLNNIEEKEDPNLLILVGYIELVQCKNKGMRRFFKCFT